MMYLRPVSLPFRSGSCQPGQSASETNWSGTNSQGMDDSRYVPQKGEEDVDPEIGLATAFEENLCMVSGLPA